MQVQYMHFKMPLHGISFLLYCSEIIEMRPWEQRGGCLLLTEDSLKMKRGEVMKESNAVEDIKTVYKQMHVHCSIPKGATSSGSKQNERDKSSLSASVRSIHRSSLSLPALEGAWAVWGWLNYRGLISMDEKQVWQLYLCLSNVCVPLCASEREKLAG